MILGLEMSLEDIRSYGSSRTSDAAIFGMVFTRRKDIYEIICGNNHKKDGGDRGSYGKRKKTLYWTPGHRQAEPQSYEYDESSFTRQDSK